jgi:hypothetical protein
VKQRGCAEGIRIMRADKLGYLCPEAEPQSDAIAERHGAVAPHYGGPTSTPSSSHDEPE